MTRTPLTVIIDTREQTPWSFPSSVKVAGRETPVTTRRATLRSGDYSILGLQGIVAVERKTVSDFCGTIGGGRERFDSEVARLSLHRQAAIVVEGSLEEVFAATAMRPASIVGSVASFFARARVPTFFAGSMAAAMTLGLGLLWRWRELETKRTSRLRFASHRRAA